MEINRYNYEIFFLDYHEGRLSDKEIAGLMSFLAMNNDLQAEFEEFSELNLEPENISLSAKEILKKSQINPNSSLFEENCIAYYENELSLSKKNTFINSFENNFQAKQIFNSYKYIFLTPDSKISFRQKNNLKHKIIYSRQVVLSILSIAASIIIVFFVFKTTPTQKITQLAIQKPEKVLQVIEDKTIKSDVSEKIQTNKILSISKKKPEINNILKDNPETIFKPKVENLAYLSSKQAIIDNYHAPNGKIIEYQKQVTTKFNEERGGKSLIQKLEKSNTNEKFSGTTYSTNTVWKMFELGINKVAQLTKTDLRMNNLYNNDGELIVFAMYSKNFEIVAPLHKN